MLRRFQNDLDLPSRTNLKLFLDFDDYERATYNIAKERAIRCIDDISTSDNSRESYNNALQKIHSLRVICNLGDSVTQESQNSLPPWNFSEGVAWDETSAWKFLEALPSLGIPITCTNCAASIETSFDVTSEVVSVYLTRCLRIWCSLCYRDSLPATGLNLCACTSACPSVKVTLKSTPRRSSNEITTPGIGRFPTKIRKLVDDLRQQAGDVKSIVFSSSLETLDLIHSALKQAGITCVQVDGRLKSKERNLVFNEFRSREIINVLLLSFQCGAVGLTLTAASRVYLMEPQWNPSIEEQALARVYRIGQTRDVTTIRFIMNNSIEKYVLEVQDKKINMISAALSAMGGSSRGLAGQRLRELRDLLE
ncbi:P-loop containing nucleoside triphosphate hydrolase protein [Durotheca rogersii]|uniref:P-loop containing nucleoside triphosphate hydrolase protein n=1 Tax=Durotheca rogersii TaxID=419775 RepID=UPI00221EE06E|nr:P-loop containing nucleoside triphosphate hydrolase protein [Durotheca rogersii]KAI5861036.1 P-loop containing nucleoside triphosphate hydrolase protein [Durotheca rogersii]